MEKITCNPKNHTQTVHTDYHYSIHRKKKAIDAARKKNQKLYMGKDEHSDPIWENEINPLTNMYPGLFTIKYAMRVLNWV